MGSQSHAMFESASGSGKKPKGVFERPKGSGIWWIRFYKDGQERRRKIGTLAQALEAYRQEKGGIGMGEWTMASLIESYLAANPELTSHSHASHGRHFQAWFAGKTVVQAVELVEQWRTERLSVVSPTTVRHQMSFLVKVFDRAVKLGLIPAHPIGGKDGLRPPRANPPRSRILGPEEEVDLLAICNQDDSDHLRFLLLTGLRRGEFMAIRWEHIRGETLNIPKGGRTGKSRSLHLKKEALEILERRRGLERPFPRAYAWCSARLYVLTRRAKISEITAHALRHTFATRLLEATGDLMAVHSALGHSSLDMTKRYLSMTSSHLKGAMERADNL